MKLSDILAMQAAKRDEGSGGGGNDGGEGKKPLKVLRTRETPNPNAMQYVLNAQVTRGKKTYSGRNDCGGDPLGEALFDLPGVQSVYITDNFVTVTKDDFTPWLKLKDPVWKTIDAHIRIYPADESGKAVVDVRDYPALSHEDKLKALEMVLDRSIRFNLAKDGGGVDLKGLEGNEVLIHYQGACGNCPSSTSGTLQYIEKQIRQQLHPDLKVRSV